LKIAKNEKNNRKKMGKFARVKTFILIFGRRPSKKGENFEMKIKTFYLQVKMAEQTKLPRQCELITLN
jgi:hypothetical protein